MKSVPETPTPRFMIELRRFEKICGNQAMLTIGQRIAHRSWYSSKEYRKVLRQLPKDQRKSAHQYLRAAQQERQYYNPEAIWLEQMLHKKVDYLKSFDVPITPAVYITGAHRMMLGAARIGITLKFERIKNNRFRIYYSSDMGMALDCVKIESVWRDKPLWDSLGVEPPIETIYHMKIRKSVATAARSEMVNSGG